MTDNNWGDLVASSYVGFLQNCASNLDALANQSPLNLACFLVTNAFIPRFTSLVPISFASLGNRVGLLSLFIASSRRLQGCLHCQWCLIGYAFS